MIIQRDGKLIVRAPYQASDEQIQAFIHQKAHWIHRKQSEAKQNNRHPSVHSFQTGDTFLFLGAGYSLEIRESRARSLQFADGRFILSISAQQRAKDLFSNWYKKQARIIIEERVQSLAHLHNLPYKKVRISSARTRWGSCSSTGTLSFTWRLVMAPSPVIDYVVVHELAHIREKNHAKRFWDTVAKMMPDFQKHRKWLKQNGHLLTLD